MCGISGVFGKDPGGRVSQQRIEAMTATLIHRGPDGEGVRLGPGYALGHRRLAIVDVAAGQQPMSNAAGDLWLTFNGEIYNHDLLREQLLAKGYRFKTRCDTEVLVHGFAEWGEELPKHLVGMFAFAIVDESKHQLFAARDRMGQKPLYYAELDDEVRFASELKALLTDRRVSRDLSVEALGEYLCLGYVPDPRTIFEGVQKLPPASVMWVRDGVVEVKEYWSPPMRPTDTGSSSDDSNAGQEELRGLLDQAVEGRMMGEVPLGAFLSGGIDSFAVVDSMSRVSDSEVVACTIGFDDAVFDEREHARSAAAACGATLHEDVLADRDMLDLDWFADVYDEPFADASAIPTYQVSAMARRHVTVALSGDGGDELFAGYRRYHFDRQENTYRSMMPKVGWSVLGAAYPKLDFMPRWLRFKRTLQNLACSPGEAYARSVSIALPEEIHPLLRPQWRSDDPLAPVREAHEEAEGCDALHRCMHADRRTWLPGDILTKVDRASMAVSLEVRSPFLDHRIVEFAARLPTDRLLLGGESKGYLRGALSPRIGHEVFDREKRGFSVPLDAWFQGRLGEALDAALADGPLSAYCDVPAIRSVLAEHRSGRRLHGRTCWSLLVLHRFLARWAA